MAILTFNAAEVEPSEHEAIPNGTYEAVITESKTQPVSTGKGIGLNLTFEIISGECKGRKVWTWINYQHANPDAQRIGRAELSAICRAVNVLQLEDTTQLHNLPLMIVVGVDRHDASRNTITRFLPCGTKQTPPTPPTTSVAQTVAPAATTVASSSSGTAPWAR